MAYNIFVYDRTILSVYL